MSHYEQQLFCQQIKVKFPQYFRDKNYLDVGSLDINGSNRGLFLRGSYIGIDLAPGKNVTHVSPAHEYDAPDGSFHTIVSTECFEHDRYYKESLKNIVRMLAPKGLFFFSCATTGRPEHGTARTSRGDSPFTSVIDGWENYYKNLTEDDIREAIDVDEIFERYEFSVNHSHCDLYFWGIKK